MQTHGARRPPAWEGILISGILWQLNKGTKTRSNPTGPNAKHNRKTLRLVMKLAAELTTAAGQPRLPCTSSFFWFHVLEDPRPDKYGGGSLCAGKKHLHSLNHIYRALRSAKLSSGHWGYKTDAVPAPGSSEGKGANKQISN